jgi:hypothetical protein
MTDAKHYYEAHVTIEPVFDDVREGAAITAQQYGFKLAKLLMQKRTEDAPERSKYDTFMTGHGRNLEDITDRTKDLVKALKAAGLNVWRYKSKTPCSIAGSATNWSSYDCRHHLVPPQP